MVPSNLDMQSAAILLSLSKAMISIRNGIDNTYAFKSSKAEESSVKVLKRLYDLLVSSVAGEEDLIPNSKEVYEYAVQFSPRHLAGFKTCDIAPWQIRLLGLFVRKITDSQLDDRERRKLADMFHNFPGDIFWFQIDARKASETPDFWRDIADSEHRQ